MRRVTAGEPAGMTLTITDEDGVAIPAVGAVTATILLETYVAVFDAATTSYKVTLSPTATANLGRFMLAWSANMGATTRTFGQPFEVVGAHYFSIADLRSFNPSLIENPGRYTPAVLRVGRDEASERFEDACKLSFTPRRTTETLRGKDDRVLVLRWNAVRVVKAVTVDDVAWTAAEIAELTVLGFGIQRPTGYTWSSESIIVVDYEHGEDSPPEPVIRAIKMLAVDHIIASAVPSRARAESSDLGTISFTLAGVHGETGIPEVDAVIEKYGMGHL